MKYLLITITAVVLVGCDESQPPEPLTVKAPAISIHKAAEQGNIEAVKQHLAAGTDVNAKNVFEQTPLRVAASSGQMEIAKLLISKGADVNATSLSGETALYIASIKGHEKIAEYLKKHGGKTGEGLKAEAKTNEEQVFDFWFAVTSGDAVDVKKAIDEGADVNAKVGGGKTPLHGAASNGFKEIAELLITNGADVNAKDDYSERTPLFDAINWKGHTEIANLLINKGANVNAKDEMQQTPLYKSIRFGNAEIAELLIANGANVNAKYGDVTTRRTVLDMAKQRPKIADLLRKHGGKTSDELKAEGK
ncbi:MAG: ankyrin repeat domain-containing protein [Verrucomicrobiota bacterium]|nr:ankyrin repeat domain-containing protein [Verrucomicrobiota bacterium]